MPVLGEKPMTDRLDHARDMVAAADRAGRLYMVSQSRRYFGGLFALRDLVTRLGGAELLDCAFFRAPHFGGFRDTMASPLLLDMAIHSFDAARFVTGAEPVSVWCEEWNPTWSWYRGAACATAVFEMTSGRFTYRGSWCSGGRPTSWNGEWRATGALGTATWDGEGTPVAQVMGEPDGGLERQLSELQVSVPEVPPETAGSLEDFLSALDTGSTPMGECHDNIRSLAMVLAAAESARRGERVRVEW
jgi:predicted dehydrogenase